MSLEAEWVAFGSAALGRLAALVSDAKGGDALAPVIVLVPTNPVGVAARRALGARPGGVANVEFTTIERLAHDVAGPVMAARGSSGLSDQVRAAAVRTVLDRDPRSLASVRHHASTDRAVADALAVIHRAEAEDVLGEGGRHLVRDVVAVGREVSARTRDHHDETDLAAVAADDPPTGAPVVVFLPEWLFPAQRRLLTAIAVHAPVRLLLGSTGDPTLDERSRRLAAVLGLDSVASVADPPAPTEVRSVSDPDDEARHAVRWLLARRVEGTSFHQMAVLYTAADPYRRALHRHLEAAGIPNNGPSMVTVAETIVGRIVTRLLDLVDSRLRRDEVMSFVASGPIRSPDGVTIRATIWDEHSRKAGVVRDLEQWRSRLSARRDRLTSGDPDPESWSARNAAFCDDLITFVTTLAADLDARPTEATWRELVTWLKGLLVRYVPGPAGRAGWPELEQETVERLDLTLDLLAGLDVIEPDPTWTSFRAAIDVELERTTRRVGRLGDGVLVGPLSSGIGVELEAVVVVGAVEGLAPRQVRHGVILGVAEHERVGTDLGGDSIELQHRRYLAALAAADGPRLVTWSRGEMRRGRRQYRSRWLEGLTDVIETESPSFAAALRPGATGPAANVAEWELRHLDELGDREAHESAVVAASPALAVGAEAIAARRWDGLSRWSGRVDPQHLAGVLDGVLSATSLERFGACSYRFFLSHVLRLEEREDPEARIDIDPRDRGTAVHEVLEQLVRARIEADTDVLPDDLERMAEISEQVFTDLEAAGKTGNPIHWELERERISDQLDDFRAFDSDLRAEGWSPVAAELGFGFGDEPPLEVAVGDQTLRFRGAADRVDRRADGAVHVVDYKTTRYAKSTDDVTAGLYQGQYLQLPLYARAALRRFGGERATAAYWYLAQGNPSARAVVDLAEVDDWFLETLDVFSRTIHDGLFATTPGEPTSWPKPTFETCKYCAFDAVCPVDRDELAARQVDDPGIAQFVELTTRELEG